ncbi:MAG: hypothetical protein QOH58_1830 [Thermoleophilaceae bacterium]|jgi:predicted N-acetyltransferase YhbS|nr:hypothetical protein [Thermoleophilaceae bacterium]
MQFRTYSEDDAPAAVELLRAAFGDWPGRRVLAGDRPADFFRWKHEANPHGRSLIVVAEEEGQLVGMRAYMPWSLTAGGAETEAVQAVDLATHPDFRGRGVSTGLLKHARVVLRETKAFALGLPNEMSRSQSGKAGWRVVGRMGVWVRIQRPLSVARGIRSMRGPAQEEALAVDAPPAHAVLAEAGWAAELLGSDSGENDGRFATATDLACLRWRYQPVLADYRAIAIPETGLAVFRLSRRGRLNEGTVCELIARDRPTKTLLLRAVAEAARFDYLAAAEPLPGARMLRSPIGGRLLGVAPYRDGVEPDPAARGSWALSLGDLERLELC